MICLHLQEYANKYLYWFKEIKQAHGAVEVTSFIQAEKINKGGIYKIGTHLRKADQEELIHGFVDSLVRKLRETYVHICKEISYRIMHNEQPKV